MTIAEWLATLEKYERHRILWERGGPIELEMEQNVDNKPDDKPDEVEDAWRRITGMDLGPASDEDPTVPVVGLDDPVSPPDAPADPPFIFPPEQVQGYRGFAKVLAGLWRSVYDTMYDALVADGVAENEACKLASETAQATVSRAIREAFLGE